MTQEEKDYCEICSIYDVCGYANRGLQRKCNRIKTFVAGFDAAVGKAKEWLCELTPEQLSDVDFDDFEKAMYK